MEKSWKTTIIGILVIVGSLAKAISDVLQGIPVDWYEVAITVGAGLGFIFAKDFNVSGLFSSIFGTKKEEPK